MVPIAAVVELVTQRFTRCVALLKKGRLRAPNVFTLQMNLPYKFVNLRFFRDDQVEDEDDASEEEGTCSV